MVPLVPRDPPVQVVPMAFVFPVFCGGFVGTPPNPPYQLLGSSYRYLPSQSLPTPPLLALILDLRQDLKTKNKTKSHQGLKSFSEFSKKKAKCLVCSFL